MASTDLERLSEGEAGDSTYSELLEAPSHNTDAHSTTKPTLLSLPLEIRLEIFSLLFSNITILLLPNCSMARRAPHHYKFRANQKHTALTHRLAHATPFTPTASTRPDASTLAVSQLAYPRVPSSLRSVLSTIPPRNHSLLLSPSLLTTSHQLSAESAPVLYRTATFRVQIPHLFAFLHARTPTQLRHLRRLALVAVLRSKLEARTFRDVMLAAAAACPLVQSLRIELRLGARLWRCACAKTRTGTVGWAKGVRAWGGGRLREGWVVLEPVEGEGVSGAEAEAMGRLGGVLEGELRGGVAAGTGAGGGEGTGGVVGSGGGW
ncbi:hypothetical protein MMC34_008214 [Xylographa carneopallida]|nr:hypothetical protein [Xylographa carneopallida]